ncbi:MAG: PrsW family glutamic-type intramembrane protease [Dehalococcoidia bacterium]|jgi:RsiW-degrading membrane proteinase PrsW (M82 family)
MLEYMQAFFRSFFYVPNLYWYHGIIAVALAFAFGAAWFGAYWTPILKKRWAWAVLVVSAFLTLLAITFVQIPLQWWVSELINHSCSETTIIDWFLLLGVPTVLISGLVQEGAKLVPVVFYWWRKGRSITPRTGLIVGAVAGLGFGVFEAIWVHNSLLAAGWNWGLVGSEGVVALSEFWGRFFAVAFHIGASALAGYGLARGWGWQFYLIASGLHALANYSVIIFSAGYFGAVGLHIYFAVVAALVTAAALWLRWCKTGEEPISPQISGAAPD